MRERKSLEKGELGAQSAKATTRASSRRGTKKEEEHNDRTEIPSSTGRGSQ